MAKKVIKISDDIYICPTCGLGPQKFYISCCDNCGQVLDWSEVKEQVPVMRPATKGERDNIDKYIDSISTRTGANFFEVEE